jgi:hypothetical protein
MICTKMPSLCFPRLIVLAVLARFAGGPISLNVTAQAQVVTAIGHNFTASTLSVDSDALPPDSDGAAGPNHFVEFINGRFSVFNKSDGVKVQTMTDLRFWNQAGVTFPNTWDVTDPRIVYDPSSQRWFASEVDFDPSGLVNTNRFLLAISATADPTGVWKAVTIPSDPGGNNSADFPTLGLDAQGVYLSGNMLDTNLNAVGATVISVPKAALLSTSPSTAGLTRFNNLSYASRGEVLQPVICFDGTDRGNILSTGGIGLDMSGNSITNLALVSFQVQNPAGPGLATLSSPTRLSVSPYTAPPFPLQPDGSANLDNGDARFSAIVYEVGGVLYAVHGTQVGDRAAVRWYRIDPVNKTILESGTLNDPTKDLFYPSIAVNTMGTVVIAYNASSASTFLSSFAVIGTTSNGVTSFGQPLLLSSGLASYQRPDFTGTSRWGDYSATSIDPADPTRFWTIQEVPASKTTWSTSVTELLTGIPKLSISSTGQTLQLTWTGTLFTLEHAPSLPNGAWTAVTQGYVTNQGVVTVQIPATDGAAFFRLHSP